MPYFSLPTHSTLNRYYKRFTSAKSGTFRPFSMNLNKSATYPSQHNYIHFSLISPTFLVVLGEIINANITF